MTARKWVSYSFWGRRWPCWGGWCCPPAGWGPPAPPTREEEIEMLRERAEWLKGWLEAVSQRLADLEKKETDLSGR